MKRQQQRKKAFRKNYSGSAVCATIDQMQSCDVLRPILASACVEIVRSIALERPSVFALGLRCAKGNPLHSVLFAAACEKNEGAADCADAEETQEMTQK